MLIGYVSPFKSIRSVTTVRSNTMMVAEIQSITRSGEVTESDCITREDPSSRLSYRIDAEPGGSSCAESIPDHSRSNLEYRLPEEARDSKDSRREFESRLDSQYLDYRLESTEKSYGSRRSIDPTEFDNISSLDGSDCSDSSLEESDSNLSQSSEEDEEIARLSSPKRELCGTCDHYRSRCICSSDEDNLDSSLHYCQWKVQLDQPFEERSHIEDIPEAISGNFAPSWCPMYTNKQVVALQYTRQRLLQFDELSKPFEESCKIE